MTLVLIRASVDCIVSLKGGKGLTCLLCSLRKIKESWKLVTYQRVLSSKNGSPKVKF